MQQKILITGFLVICILAGMLAAGCTSKNAGTAAQTPDQPPAVTSGQPEGTVSTPGAATTDLVAETADQGLVAEDAVSLQSEADIVNITQDANMTPDSVDLGDIVP